METAAAVCIHFLLDCRMIVYVLLIVLSLFLKPLKDKIASMCGYRGWGQTSIQRNVSDC